MNRVFPRPLRVDARTQTKKSEWPLRRGTNRNARKKSDERGEPHLPSHLGLKQGCYTYQAMSLYDALCVAKYGILFPRAPSKNLLQDRCPAGKMRRSEKSRRQNPKLRDGFAEGGTRHTHGKPLQVWSLVRCSFALLDLMHQGNQGAPNSLATVGSDHKHAPNN